MTMGCAQRHVQSGQSWARSLMYCPHSSTDSFSRINPWGRISAKQHTWYATSPAIGTYSQSALCIKASSAASHPLGAARTSAIIPKGKPPGVCQELRLVLIYLCSNGEVA